MSREARQVLTNCSLPTLVVLSIFLVGAHALQGVSVRLEQRLGLTVHRAVVCQSRNAAETLLPMRDFDQTRPFLTAAGPVAVVAVHRRLLVSDSRNHKLLLAIRSIGCRHTRARRNVRWCLFQRIDPLLQLNSIAIDKYAANDVPPEVNFAC